MGEIDSEQRCCFINGKHGRGGGLWVNTVKVT